MNFVFYAIKIRKLATDATLTSQETSASMEGKFLGALAGHPNIIKLHRCTLAPLPDTFSSLIPALERPPFTKVLRGGARRNVNGLVMDYHESNLFVAVDRERADDEKFPALIVRMLRG